MTFQFTRKNVVLLLSGLGAIIVLALGATWTMYDLYIKRGDDAFARSVAPLFPAARVAGRVLSYKDFLDARDTLKLYLVSDAAKQSGLAQPLTPSLEKDALDRLVRQAVIEEVAKEKSVAVSDEDVRAAFDEVVNSTSSTTPNVAQYLKETFNWTEDEFRMHVMRPALLEQRLAAAITTSTDDQPAALDAAVQERGKRPDVKFYLKFSLPPAAQPTAAAPGSPAAPAANAPTGQPPEAVY